MLAVAGLWSHTCDLPRKIDPAPLQLIGFQVVQSLFLEIAGSGGKRDFQFLVDGDQRIKVRPDFCLEAHDFAFQIGIAGEHARRHERVLGKAFHQPFDRLQVLDSLKLLLDEADQFILGRHHEIAADQNRKSK